MTEPDIIAHWRKGAKDALDVAKLIHANGNYAYALFYCHLSVEKALKAEIMEKTGKPHPKIHGLFQLASLLDTQWSKEDRLLFDNLSDFAIAARYDDIEWEEQFANAQHVQEWIARAEKFLTDHALI